MLEHPWVVFEAGGIVVAQGYRCPTDGITRPPGAPCPCQSTSASTPPESPVVAEPEQKQDVAGGGDPPQRPPFEATVQARIDRLYQRVEECEDAGFPHEASFFQTTAMMLEKLLEGRWQPTVPVAGNQPDTFAGARTARMQAFRDVAEMVRRWPETRDTHATFREVADAIEAMVPTGGRQEEGPTDATV